jgi:hypothetical protein
MLPPEHFLQTQLPHLPGFFSGAFDVDVRVCIFISPLVTVNPSPWLVPCGNGRGSDGERKDQGAPARALHPGVFRANGATAALRVRKHGVMAITGLTECTTRQRHTAGSPLSAGARRRRGESGASPDAASAPRTLPSDTSEQPETRRGSAELSRRPAAGLAECGPDDPAGTDGKPKGAMFRLFSVKLAGCQRQRQTTTQEQDA